MIGYLVRYGSLPGCGKAGRGCPFLTGAAGRQQFWVLTKVAGPPRSRRPHPISEIREEPNTRRRRTARSRSKRPVRSASASATPSPRSSTSVRQDSQDQQDRFRRPKRRTQIKPEESCVTCHPVIARPQPQIRNPQLKRPWDSPSWWVYA
jgi:hypothetical protein